MKIVKLPAVKKLARYVSLRRRYAAITANERVRARRMRTYAVAAAIKYRQTNDPQMHRVASVAFYAYLSIISDVSDAPERPLRWHVSVDTFDSSNCKNFFSFRKEDLRRLFTALRIPDEISLENRSKMTGEEVALRGLYELVNGEDQHNIAENVFGRDFSQQGRAFKWFCNHIYDTFADLLLDNLQWWYDNGYIEQSRRAIEAKVASKGVLYDVGTFSVCAFIDCNCLETACPGSGPTRAGPDAPRWHDWVQKAFYNGWKSTHGLKHQTVDIAHGMTIHMYGPASVRRNDLKLLGQSQINAKLRDMQVGNALQMILFGDSAYPTLSHLTSYHSQDGITQQQKEENKALKALRISIEWNYMVTANMFAYIKQFNKLRMLASDRVVKIYTVATLLRNCCVSLYGSQTSDYFNVDIPHDMLEKYLQVY